MITADTELTDKQRAKVAIEIAKKRGIIIKDLLYKLRAVEEHLKRGNVQAARSMLRKV